MTQPKNNAIHSDSDRYTSHPHIEVPKTSFLTRLFNSTISQATIGTIAFIKGCVQPLTTGRSDPTTMIISWIALGILFETREENWIKRLIYEVTICGVFGWDSVNKSFNWADVILPATAKKGALVLSSQPLKNKGHHVTYRNWAVLSMNERPELSWTSPVSDPVSPEDWKVVSPHRDHKILECCDYYPVPTPIIIQAVKWIHAKREQGVDVLVHCKAGKGRSGTVAICYLLFLKFLAGELKPPYKPHILEVMHEVKRKRSFVATGSQAHMVASLYLKNIIKNSK